MTWSRDDAVDELEGDGFNVAVVLVPGTSSQRGKVISQTPNAGTAAEGSTVTINVGTTTGRRREAATRAPAYAR